MGRSEVEGSEVRPLSLGVKLAYNMAFLIQYARISSLKLVHRHVGLENRAKSEKKSIEKRIEKMMKKRCVLEAAGGGEQ